MKVKYNCGVRVCLRARVSVVKAHAGSGSQQLVCVEAQLALPLLLVLD